MLKIRIVSGRFHERTDLHQMAEAIKKGTVEYFGNLPEDQVQVLVLVDGLCLDGSLVKGDLEVIFLALPEEKRLLQATVDQSDLSDMVEDILTRFPQVPKATVFFAPRSKTVPGPDASWE